MPQLSACTRALYIAPYLFIEIFYTFISVENRVNKVERFVNSKKLRKGPEEEKIEGKTMEEKEDIGKGYDKSHFPFFIRDRS